MAIKKNQVIFDENLEIESQDTTSIQQYSSLQNFFRGIAPYATDWIPYVIFNATNENQNVGIPAEYLTMDFVETVTHNGETYYAYERDFPKAIVGSSRATKVTVELGFFASQEDLIGVKLYDETVEGYNDTTYIASQLLVDFPDATDGQIVRVFNTDSDWVYNSGTSSWIDSVSKIATELQEHRSVPVEYALIGGKSTTPPTHAPTNTQIIIDQLNDKINRTEVTNNFFNRTQSDERFYNISGDTLEGDMNANSNDILNVSNITPTSITFDTDKVLSWSNTNGTLELTLSDGVTVQLGQENLVYVRNTSGALLTEGQPVRLSGTLGNRPEAFPVDIANDTHAQTTIGLVTSAGGIANNAFGHVATFGLVRELDTSAYAVGDILWVNPSGGLTNNRADIVAPNNVIKIGYVVTSSATNGVIFVCLDRLQKLNELSDVFGTPSDEDIVMYDSVNGRFFYFDLKGYVDTRIEDLVKSASYNSVNGVLTFTRDNDTTFTIDLPLEQLIVSGEYDEINKDLIFTLDNGSTITIPVDDIFVGLATQTWVNTQLENYYTQAQVDTIAQAKIDLDLGNTSVVTDMVSTDLFYVYRPSDGTYKRISFSALLGDITTETGSFSPIATYEDLTAGTAYAQTIHTLLLNTGAQVYINLKAIEQDKIYHFRLPTITSTNTLQISIDNQVNYYNVQFGGQDVQGTLVSGNQIDVYWNGTNWQLYEIDVVENTHPYVGASGVHTTPKNGITAAITKETLSPYEEVKGRTFAVVSADNAVIDTGTITFDSVTGVNYYDTLNDVVVAGDGTTKTLTNSSGVTAEMMAIQLPSDITTASGALTIWDGTYLEVGLYSAGYARTYVQADYDTEMQAYIERDGVVNGDTIDGIYFRTVSDGKTELSHVQGELRGIGGVTDTLTEQKFDRDYNDVVQSTVSWGITGTQTNTHIFFRNLQSTLLYKIVATSATFPNIQFKINDDIFTVTTQNGIETNDIENLITITSAGFIWIRVNKTTYATSGDFETYLQANDVEFIFELATPITREIIVDGQQLVSPTSTYEQFSPVLSEFDVQSAISLQGQMNINVKSDIEQQKDIQVLEETVDKLNIGQMTDLRFPATQTKIGALNKPDFDETNIGLLFPENDETEAVFIIAQMPHSWQEGTTIFPHVHIRQAQATVPKFEMEYKIYNVGDTVPASFSNYVMDTGLVTYTSGTIGQLITGTGGIDMTGYTASAIIIIKLYRQTGDGVTGDVLFDEFDIHYYVDKFGKDVM